MLRLPTSAPYEHGNVIAMMEDTLHLTFYPTEESISAIYEGWNWLLLDWGEPFLCTIFGDVFLNRGDSGIFLLDTGVATIKRVADGIEPFWPMLLTELGHDWLLADLAEQLSAAGIIPAAGQCYSYKIFPIFREGTYAPDNFTIVSACEYFSYSGTIHAETTNLPDGTKIEITAKKLN